jgi:hypothetical protein
MAEQNVTHTRAVDGADTRIQDTRGELDNLNTIIKAVESRLGCPLCIIRHGT